MAGADIALFPEMWNIGYRGYAGNEANAADVWIDQAIGETAPSFRVSEARRRYSAWPLQSPIWARTGGRPLNAVSLIDRTGKVLFTYGKVHTCCYEIPEVVCSPGDGFRVSNLDTRAGTVKVGAMICHDREFPESARLLMIDGAELILTPNACSLKEYDSIRIYQFRARAFENMVAMAMANYPGPKHDGHSIACNPDGAILVEANEAEGIDVAEFDLDAIRAWRASECWGDAFGAVGLSRGSPIRPWRRPSSEPTCSAQRWPVGARQSGEERASSQPCVISTCPDDRRYPGLNARSLRRIRWRAPRRCRS